MATNVAQPELIPANDPHWKAPDALAVVTPMTLLQSAAQRGAGPEELKEWMELYREWKKDCAREAYVSDMNAFKEQPPEIKKNKHVKFGNTEYDHATLDHVTDTVAQGLSRHGFSHRWDVEQDAVAKTIKVTCVITHKLGHSERTALEGIADTSGSKNAIQAIGSAVTYLQRYTLLSATGLAAKNMDDDGNGAGKVMEDLNDHLEYIANARNPEELRRLYDTAYDIAESKNNTRAMKALLEAKNAKYRELVPAAAKNTGRR